MFYMWIPQLFSENTVMVNDTHFPWLYSFQFVEKRRNKMSPSFLRIIPNEDTGTDLEVGLNVKVAAVLTGSNCALPP